MTHALVAFFSLLIAVMTFFSGFGLGTLLMPVFAIFFPVPVAIAATAVVHLANNIFKVGLIGKKANRRIVLFFGIPAVTAAFIGAWLLGYLADLAPLYSYELFGMTFFIYPVKLIIGILIIFFSMFELLPALDRFAFSSKWIPLGGLLSGFFGGLSGHQGALRSMFLVRSGLTKEGFIGSVVVIAVAVDIMRLFVYGLHRFNEIGNDAWSLVITAVIFAWAGSFLGSKVLKKVTMESIRKLIGTLLLLIGAGLTSGII